MKTFNLLNSLISRTGNLVKSTLVFKEFWEAIRGKMSGTRNVRVGTVEKEGKDLNVLATE